MRPKGHCVAATRRGSVYVVVAGTAAIVSLLALAGLLTVRQQRQRVAGGGALCRARMNAETGLEVAVHRIRTSSDWRAQVAKGQWTTDAAVGDGTCRFALSDPEDGDLAGPAANEDYAYQPVEVAATGTSGQAVQKLRLRLDFPHTGVEALRSSVHTAGSLRLRGVQARSDHVFTAQGDIRAEMNGVVASDVYADVAAGGSVTTNGSSRFHGATDLDVRFPLTMPEPSAVLDYYLSHGTSISITDIPLWDCQLLSNPSMEGPPPNPPTTGWRAYGYCLLTPYTAAVKDGTYSLRAHWRLTVSSGPSQDITSKLASGVAYHVQIHARFVSHDDRFARLVVEYQSTGSGLQVWRSDWKTLNSDKFVRIESDPEPDRPYSFRPSWSGRLTRATLRVETKTSLNDLIIDAASLKEIASQPATVRAIHRTVLSPDRNPFGNGQTNPQGIYVVDCQDNWVLSIQRSRIVGTLVVLNPKDALYVWSVVHWSPAVANYPAILSNGKVNLWLGSQSVYQLDEGSDNVNYNPPGLPYRGLSDEDQLDVYPALVRGIIYTSSRLSLKYRPTIEGLLLAGTEITSEAASQDSQTLLDVSYSSRFYNDAPPGFRGATQARVVPGSTRREAASP